MRVHEAVARPESERGFALILAILALMLLTFLGLALATSTSTELQIATNYRWGLQALYNAEGGLDVGRQMLRSVADWSTVLPAARTGAATWTVTCTGDPAFGQAVTCALDTTTTQCPGGTSGASCTAPAPRTLNDTTGVAVTARDYENSTCDQTGSRVGYGLVMLNASGQAVQNVRSYQGSSANGSFTLWVRRPLLDSLGAAAGVTNYTDDTNNRTLILTSEGVAPFLGTPTASRAVRVVEATITQGSPLATVDCDNARAGQEGSGPEGAGFAGCSQVTAAGVGTGLGQAGVTENTGVR